MAESWSRGAQWILTRMEYPNYRGGEVVLPTCTNVVTDLIDDFGRFDNNGFVDNRDKCQRL